MVLELLQRWNKNFSNLGVVELDYNPFLGFGYCIEDKGEKFFLTKNKINNESLVEIHSFKQETTTQSLLVPPEALHLALRLIDRIEKPLKETKSVNKPSRKKLLGVENG